ncbi:MAG TPA: hypothetical protein VGV60_05255 [Candidatus Polarisedimenticolia bacterium]|nr:hypothetical protein [Candidatus Polarisedimenticolia bacterium]
MIHKRPSFNDLSTELDDQRPPEDDRRNTTGQTCDPWISPVNWSSSLRTAIEMGLGLGEGRP